MACCLALALIIGVVRTCWHRLVHRRTPPRAGFPPPATRSAPASAPAGVAAVALPAPSVPAAVAPVAPSGPAAVAPVQAGPALAFPSPGRGPAEASPAAPAERVAGVMATTLAAAVLGVGLYAAALGALVVSGVVEAGPGAAPRTIGLVVAGGLASLTTRAGRRPARPAHPSRAGRRSARPAGPADARSAAWTLAGAGAGWSLLSVLDMHITGFVPERLVGPVADLVLHGPGVLALVLGGAALLAGDRYLSVLLTGDPL